MEHLQHDPRTKTYIKDMLFSFLYQSVEKNFKKRLDNIITKNALLNSYSHLSFVYKGELYSCDSLPPPRKSNRLAPQMKQDMDLYLTELKELNEREIPYVIGYIKQVLNSSKGLSDYLLLLPTAIHYPLEQLIKSCPCSMHYLSTDDVEQFKLQNKEAIDLLKQRLIINLLI